MRVLVFFLLGGLLGAAASGALSARLIHWWAVPPFQNTGCDWGPAIAWAVERLLVWEAIGAAIGAVGLALFYAAVLRRKKAPPPPPPGATPKAA